jgi:hypothetical protein
MLVPVTGFPSSNFNFQVPIMGSSAAHRPAGIASIPIARMMALVLMGISHTPFSSGDDESVSR